MNDGPARLHARHRHEDFTHTHFVLEGQNHRHGADGPGGALSDFGLLEPYSAIEPEVRAELDAILDRANCPVDPDNHDVHIKAALDFRATPGVISALEADRQAFETRVVDPNARTLKDSGERHAFETGAQRDNSTGKGRYDLLPVLALRRLATTFEKGAEKYAARNWEKGIPLSRYIDAAMRHLMKHLEGWTDEDHAAQALWNVACMIQTQEMVDRGLLPRELSDLPSYLPEGATCWPRDNG